jgi:hypothetical protein
MGLRQPPMARVTPAGLEIILIFKSFLIDHWRNLP